MFIAASSTSEANFDFYCLSRLQLTSRHSNTSITNPPINNPRNFQFHPQAVAAFRRIKKTGSLARYLLITTSQAGQNTPIIYFETHLQVKATNKRAADRTRDGQAAVHVLFVDAEPKFGAVSGVQHMSGPRDQGNPIQICARAEFRGNLSPDLTVHSDVANEPELSLNTVSVYE